MYALTLTASLVLVFCATAFASSECVMPKSLSSPDWDRIGSKIWYLAMTTNDTLSLALSCELLYNFSPNRPNTILMDNVQYDWRYRQISLLGVIDHLQDEMYQVRLLKPVGPLEAVWKNKRSVMLNEEDIAPENVMIKHQVSFITNSADFFIIIFCGESGEWIVWVYTTTQTPAGEDIEMAWSVLGELGVGVNLKVFFNCELAVDLARMF